MAEKAFKVPMQSCLALLRDTLKQMDSPITSGVDDETNTVEQARHLMHALTV